MPKVTVDGIEVEVDASATVLQACELAGAEIPRFCYHERLSIAGNCRMCLVEVERAPKPVASCAQPVTDGMVVHTKTEKVKRAREGVMEFLLINHPLDCPICDQGGECDLQDQAMGYGIDNNRYAENKRAVEDKDMGPLIATTMTRCIHCTRCVRFITEVSGVAELGATGRGEDMEITTYLEKALTSELQGNVIDLCPVGALTSKPYAFTARPWELKKTETIDVMDAMGSNIRVDSRGREVMRVMPRVNEAINEEWISDKTRFIWDGLKTQRLDRPYVREDGKLRAATWDEAFEKIAEKVASTTSDKMAAIAGDLADVESMKALKDLMVSLGVTNLDCRQDGAKIGTGGRGSYIFNSGIEAIEEADALLVIGSNPRLEAPVLNARIRKQWTKGGFPIGVVGEDTDLTYPTDYLGAGTDTLKQIIDGSHPFARVMEVAENPMIIVGQGALTREDGEAVLAAIIAYAKSTGVIKDGWNGFNVLHTAAARVGGLDLGFLPGEEGRDTQAILDGAAAGALDLVFLLGADEIETKSLGNAFVVYQGTHGDAGAHCADVILPGAAYTEKSGLYVNTEGRVQMAKRAAFPPGDAREDWAILRALSATLGKPLPYDSLRDLRAALYEDVPHFATLDDLTPVEVPQGSANGAMAASPFTNAIKDFYMTNPIARASKVMADCAALAKGTDKGATGTHG